MNIRYPIYEGVYRILTNEPRFTLHDQTDKKITSSYVKYKILPPLHSTHYQQLAV